MTVQQVCAAAAQKGESLDGCDRRRLEGEEETCTPAGKDRYAGKGLACCEGLEEKREPRNPKSKWYCPERGDDHEKNCWATIQMCRSKDFEWTPDKIAGLEDGNKFTREKSCGAGNNGKRPEPISAMDILHCQDTGVLALFQSGKDGPPKAIAFNQDTENLKIPIRVQDGDAYAGLAQFNGQVKDSTNIGEFLFASLSVITMPPEDSENPTGFIYTDWGGWIDDERIGQAFHFGYLGEENENDVVWGWAIFGFIESDEAKELLPDNYTGYAIVEDIFCFGSWEYCQPIGENYMKSKGWNFSTCEERPAPSLVTENDLVSKGMMMRIPDAKDMPDYCGKIWFSGDQ